jgi:hypothetical protein
MAIQSSGCCRADTAGSTPLICSWSVAAVGILHGLNGLLRRSSGPRESGGGSACARAHARPPLLIPYLRPFVKVVTFEVRSLSVWLHLQPLFFQRVARFPESTGGPAQSPSEAGETAHPATACQAFSTSTSKKKKKKKTPSRSPRIIKTLD